MSARLRIGLALLWLALLLLAGWWIGGRLQLTGDLRKFMPSPETPEQKLLIDELGEGPGSRLLLVALSGADAPVLAAQSKALRAALARDPQFVLAANGEDAGLDAIPERLRPYRYLLSPTLKTLTKATTSDSIWALSGSLLTVSLLLGDYRTVPVPYSSPSPLSMPNSTTDHHQPQEPASKTATTTLAPPTIFASRSCSFSRS